jgi:hypothetical protein
MFQSEMMSSWIRFNYIKCLKMQEWDTRSH